MNILITNHSLRDRAGTERYTLEISRSMKSRGHSVIVYSPNLGDFAKEFENQEIQITDSTDELLKHKFDVIHAHHNITAILARSLFPITPMVFLSHGVVPILEQPPSVDLGISRYIAVSEEVKQNLIDNGIVGDRVEIVRNFVDTEKFKPRKQVNKTIKNLLVISNHLTEENVTVIEGTCKELGLNYTHIGLPENPVSNVEEYINNADLVITLGKGVLESMVCKRNVIVYDRFGGDGFVDASSYNEIRKNNFSGRRYEQKYKIEDLKKEILKYDPKLGDTLQKIVLSNHTVKKATDDLLKIYREVGDEKVSKSLKKRSLMMELLFLEDYFTRAEEIYQSLLLQNKRVEHLEEELDNASKFISKLEKESKKQTELLREQTSILRSPLKIMKLYLKSIFR